MVKVSYQPRKEVIIHEYSRYNSLDDLIRNVYAGAPPGATVGPLRWINGIVLTFTPFTKTDRVNEELMAGRLHWNHVSFAPMEEYTPNYHMADRQLNFAIVDVSVNPVFRAIGEFIIETLMHQN